MRLTDQAGNVGAESTSAYVLDTGPPNTVLLTGPTSPGRTSSPVWQIVGDSDAVLECRLTGPGISAPAFAPCAATAGVPGSGTFTAQLTVAEGVFVLTARSRDSAGNLGPESTSSYTLDTVAPAAPSVPRPPLPNDREPTILWTFTSEVGTTALCTLTSGAQVNRAESVCASPYSTDLGPFGDGTYQLVVRVVDAAGNTSPSVAGQYVLDRTPSQSPSIVASPANRSPDTTPTWRVALASPADLLECRLVGLAGSDWTGCGASGTREAVALTFDLAPATSGTYVLQVREVAPRKDPSPVTSSGTYTLDLTAPWTVDVVPPQPQRDKTHLPVFQVIRQPQDSSGNSLTCQATRFDGGPAVVTPCGVGDNTVDLSVAAPPVGALTGDGDVVLTVRTQDGAGRLGPRSSATYHYDDLAPAAPTLLALGADRGYTGDLTWSFTTADPDDVFVCRVVRGLVAGPTAPALAPCTSPWAVTLPTTGAWTFEVASVDVVGTRSDATSTSSYTYLAAVPSLLPRGPVAGTDATPRWTFPVPRGLTATCSVTGPGGVSVASARDCSQGTFTLALPEVAGSYTLAVVLSDGFSQGRPGLTSYAYTSPVRGGLLGQPAPAGPGVGPGPSRGGPGGGAGVPRPVGPGPVAGGPADRPAPTAADLVPRGPGVAAPPVTAIRRPGATAVLPALPTPNLDEVPRIIGKAITDLGRRPTIPLVLLGLVVGFLLLQNRIDRRDPKLAEAPMGAEPELDFGPVLSRGPGRPGQMAPGQIAPGGIRP